MELVQANFLEVPFPKRFHAMVANIPYNITSPILHRVLTELGPSEVIARDNTVRKLPAKRAILLVQKEFGDRMLAKYATILKITKQNKIVVGNNILTLTFSLFVLAVREVGTTHD